MGRRVLGKTSELRSIAASTGARWLFVAIGDNWARGELTQRALAQVPALQLATVIHPAAQIARGVEIGEGSVAMAGVVVNYPARIGRGCILNTRSSLDHDGELGEFASLAPGATLGGNVVVGAYSAVGLGANVIHRVAIGEHTVVGAGALVLDDLPPNVVAYGSPARVVRERRADEPYLSRPARNPHP
jgi:sugar O-acyltransferase (sialic acid O-acetyltransferase NeuD family)